MDNAPAPRQPTIVQEWGERGAAAVCPGADYAVIVDVLSFTTSLSVAIDAGVEVFPYRWRDESAAEFARRHNAVLAHDRSTAPQPGVITLSPTSISPAASGRFVDATSQPVPHHSARRARG